MAVLDKRAMPKEIAPANLRELNGETAYWYCPACRKWRTSLITADGITCPACGAMPDWKKHTPILAYQSRYKRVMDLCAPGSEFRKKYEEAGHQYADYIDQTYAGMSVRARDTGWRYFQGIWQEADEVANYLLAAQDTPKVNVPYAYSTDGLRRRYYDPRRSANIVSLSDLTDDDGVCYTYDTAEAASYAAGYRHPFDDERIEIIEYLGDISGQLERAVAHDLAEGCTKRDIERKYGLTERRVRTIVSHIAKSLKRV